MSTQGNRCYRPKLHFTPASMWINDPNGMVYAEDNYHLFYQHYPEKPVWGPMHWGHAISKDLLYWEHLPIAIYPDELGYAFSGSCILDLDNTSGFGSQGKAPMIAIYTSHDGNTNAECQSIAYSTDYINFIKYEGNPVIKNPGINDFRDPKAFWNPVMNCWSLVIAASDRVNFYYSKDFRHWEQTGEFCIGANGLAGICECPDCFPVATAEGTKWILIISMIVKSDHGEENLHKTQYYVGEFNGSTFVDTEESEEPLWLNYGFDHYAGVTFQNADRPILMGWANNWSYAREIPTNDYRGQMSFACEVMLTKTNLGYRIALKPIGLEQYMASAKSAKELTQLESQTFGLRVKGEGYARITLANSEGEQVIIEITEDQISIDRTNADSKVFSEKYGEHYFNKVSVNRYNKGAYQLDMFFDVSILEVFAEEGLIPVTTSVYPEKPYEYLKAEGNLTASLFYMT